jgi:hypothetical protein
LKCGGSLIFLSLFKPLCFDRSILETKKSSKKMKYLLGIALLFCVAALGVSAQSCNMAGSTYCPLLHPLYQNDTYCAHDVNNPWCYPPGGPGASSHCGPLPAGEVAELKPGCNKCAVRFANNEQGNIYNWCNDASDGCIYVRWNFMYQFYYFCASSPDATTPVLPAPAPIAAPVPVAAPIAVPVAAPVPVVTPLAMPVAPPRGKKN